ncbi:DOPA 4,5-dioxygenase family protein [Achromobacter aloeverae]|uniref:Aromatic ring-cleaving dioxygenase n=1 Tax=Achromobacter aloeverae TaxID=1750518 RepID=A0A4Q1HLZ6_9BURK|nr:DOPA 4,5-dioxygenase family protein [Achromobacter aloeverae]RXN91210.1 aromatic ring-cleaving dioxygenase [Achromobacter aloeverae]
MDKALAGTPAASGPDRAVQALDTIRSYHAHIYFDGPAQRQAAEILREEISLRFSVLLGRWHDTLVGPHARPMYQVAFAVAEYARFVPWLMINRRGLAVLVHPNTGRPRTDHTDHALWMGEVLGILNPQRLPDMEGPEPAIVPNTQPTLTA